MNQLYCSCGSVKAPTRCAECGSWIEDIDHRPSTTTQVLCGRCCPVCRSSYRPLDEVAAIHQKLERNEQHGPLTFQEWAYLVQTMESIYNDWTEVTERVQSLLDKLCRAHGLDWRELFCKHRLKKPYAVVANEQYGAMEEDLLAENHHAIPM